MCGRIMVYIFLYPKLYNKEGKRVFRKNILHKDVKKIICSYCIDEYLKEYDKKNGKENIYGIEK